MELRHLKYFRAVAQEKSFIRAAKRLNVSRPPLSRQIRDLEEELGVQLFRRDKHSVELTDAGETLLLESKKVMLSLGNALEAVKSASNGASGSMVIQAAPSICHRFTSLILSFAQKHPDVVLDLKQDTACAAIKEVRDNRATVAFSRDRVADPQLSFRQISAEHLVAVVSKKHPLAKRRKIGVRDVVGQRLLMFSRQASSILHEATLTAFSAGDVRPNIVREIRESELEACLLTIAMGKSVGIFGDAIKALGVARTELRFLPLAPPAPELPIFQLWRKDNTSRLLHHFLAQSELQFPTQAQTP